MATASRAIPNLVVSNLVVLVASARMYSPQFQEANPEFINKILKWTETGLIQKHMYQQWKI